MYIVGTRLQLLLALVISNFATLLSPIHYDHTAGLNLGWRAFVVVVESYSGRWCLDVRDTIFL